MDSFRIYDVKLPVKRKVLKRKIDIKANSDTILNKIVNILTKEFDEEHKFKIEEIKIFNEIEYIDNINTEALNDFIVTFRKKLFIFDLKVLGRDWTKNISYIPQNEITKKKYKNNILFLEYIYPHLKVTVFPRHGDVNIDTVYSFLKNMNTCNFCKQLKKHVKINCTSGQVMCLECFEQLSKVSLNELETIHELLPLQ